MCGRFALGVPASEIRAGIVHHFPRMLNNPRAAARRARAGAEERVRRGEERQRRRGRGGAAGRGAAAQASAARSSAREEVPPQEFEEEDEAYEWPASDEDVAPARGGAEEDEQALGARLHWENEERFRQGNFNVAPRSNGVVLRLRPSSSDLRLRGGGEGGEVVEEKEKERGLLDIGDQELVIETMQWGLIPHWSKHPPSGPLNTINARSENLIDNAGGMWQSLKGPKRCLVVVQGYYEWQKKGTTKIPHFTKLPSDSSATPRLMLLAGLYDTVKYIDSPASDPPIKTFTICTTIPCKSLAWLHDRMPCILEKEEECVRWLDCRDGWTADVAKLLRPYEGEIECYPVPTEVGKIGNNSPSFILPVKERKDGIANFFKKQTDEGVSVKPDAVHKGKGVPDAKPVLGKRSLEGKNEDHGRGEKKPKVEPRGKVHSPVSKDTIDVDVKAEKAANHKSAVPSKREEQEFELGIGDDSNAPNPTTPSKAKGKAKQESPSAEVTVVSPRQTRSSAKKALPKQESGETPARGSRDTKGKPKVEDAEEVQVLSPPETPHATKGKSYSKTGSAKTAQAETKVNKSEIRSTKAKGATIRGGTGEEGLESTHQTRLDGFLKHED